MTSNIFEYDSIFYYYHHLCELAERIGVETTCFILDSFEKKITRIYRKQLAILRLKNRYGSERLEKAAARANYYNKQNAADLLWLLKNGLEYLPMDNHTDFLGQKHHNFG
jgi:hypothetical protein